MHFCRILTSKFSLSCLFSVLIRDSSSSSDDNVITANGGFFSIGKDPKHSNSSTSESLLSFVPAGVYFRSCGIYGRAMELADEGPAIASSIDVD